MGAATNSLSFYGAREAAASHHVALIFRVQRSGLFVLARSAKAPPNARARGGYSPNLTLKNWLAPGGGVTSMVVFTALFFSFTSTPLVIGDALSSPSTVLAA